jgi:myo-inositol-1(or 4)-monophosphatase
LWVIDPIDGTVNYASHLPFFAVSIAVQHRDLTLASVVHLPALGETFTAIKGQGAFLGPIRLKVAPLKISEATISVILTSHFSSVDTQKTLSVLSELMGQVRGTRIFVCEALELAYIAAGRLSGNLCVKADAYGAAAGQLLIEEAGGKVTDFKGRPFGNESKNIIASNGIIHDYLVGICKSREQR